MKTHIIPDSTVQEVYGKPGSSLDHWERFECNHCGQPSINPDICVHCGCEIGLTITPQADAVKPIKPTLEDIPDLSKKIARKIFSLGDEPGSPCRRIQFLGGTWPHKENDQGGCSESSLADIIRIELTENKREDFTPELTTILHRRIEGLLADAEALSDEIEHLRAVAHRAQQREVEAVKRADQAEAQICRLTLEKFMEGK